MRVRNLSSLDLIFRVWKIFVEFDKKVFEFEKLFTEFEKFLSSLGLIFTEFGVLPSLGHDLAN